MPEQSIRVKEVGMKLSPIPEVLRGKKVIVVDDSIVRGTTIGKIVKMVRDAGAKEVHVRISCPPVKYPDFYGIDTPSQQELISSQKSVEEVKDLIGADSLHFLSFENLIKATNLSADQFCTSCFTGIYPIDLGEKADTISDIQYAAP